MATNPSWYLLNFVPQFPFRSESAAQLVDNFNIADSAALQLFAPSFIQADEVNGRLRVCERPLLYHYLFLRGPEHDVRRFCSRGQGFSLIRNHSDNTYVTVPDAQIEAFRHIARYYGNALPCFPADAVELQDGDIVEVVKGDFPGLRGVYIPKKRGTSGKIVIGVTQSLATAVYDIKVEYLRIIKFAKGSRRAYDQIDAFVPRLLRALEAAGSLAATSDTADGCRQDSATPPAVTDALPAQIIAPLIVFARRFDTVRLDSPKIQAKLHLLLQAADRILGDSEAASRHLAEYHRLAHHITNPKTLSLVETLLPTTNS